MYALRAMYYLSIGRAILHVCLLVEVYVCLTSISIHFGHIGICLGLNLTLNVQLKKKKEKLKKQRNNL